MVIGLVIFFALSLLGTLVVRRSSWDLVRTA